MAVVGYARVSTIDQNASLQIDALKAAGCTRIFEDHASGSREDRPELTAALDYVREGDTLAIWKLDRLGRSLPHLLQIAGDLQARGVELLITSQGIDTRTAAGRLVYGILGSVAEYEKTLIVERTKAGLEAARARGLRGGRKPSLKPRQAQLAREMYAERGEDGRRAHTVAAIARELKIGRTTVYGYLKDPAESA
jgi:DNA invertase Pin-like site-specific DNA recombinase